MPASITSRDAFARRVASLPRAGNPEDLKTTLMELAVSAGFKVCEQSLGLQVICNLMRISESQIDVLQQLSIVFGLLYFPSQKLSWSDQVRVAGWFGPVVEQTPSYLAATPEKGGLGDSELPFHSDLSCTPEPLLGISLHALEVSEGAAPTKFVDAVSAVAALTNAQRARLEGLHIRNLWPLSLSERQRATTVGEDWPGADHDLIKSHPVSGAPLLYLNESHSDRIVELAKEESEQLISELFTILYHNDRIYEHHWKAGDLLIWDNLALQHSRAPSPPGVVRTLQRVTLGSSSFLDLMPPEVAAAYGLS